VAVPTCGNTPQQIKIGGYALRFLPMFEPGNWRGLH
jgi:hypothetical protein